jgi:outer membrane protein W
MKRVLIFSSILFFYVLSLSSFCLADEKSGNRKKEEINNPQNPLIYLLDKENFNVAVGVRSTYFQLTESRRYLIGHLNVLEEDQNLIPYKPMIQVNLSKYLAFEFGYDQFKAMALNEPDYNKYWSDGDLEWAPYMFALQFRWPHFHHSVVPYVLGGVTYNKTSFKEHNWYHYGFPSSGQYEEWVGQGNRMENYTDYRRIIKADDSWGALLGIGVDYFIWKHLALNLDLRYHWTQSDLTFQLADSRGVFGEDHGTFNMNSWIIGLGLKYFFF